MDSETNTDDLRAMVFALGIAGWQVDKTLLYDEEGIEGWRWTSPQGNEWNVIGDWSELPQWPDAAMPALIKAGYNPDRHR